MTKQMETLSAHSLTNSHVHFLHLWSATPQMILIESEVKSKFDHTLFSCVSLGQVLYEK